MLFLCGFRGRYRAGHTGKDLLQAGKAVLLRAAEAQDPSKQDLDPKV